MCIRMLKNVCFMYYLEMIVAICGMIASAFFYELEPWTFFLWWLFMMSFVIWFLAELVEITYIPSDRLRCCSWYAIAAAVVFFISGVCEITYNYLFNSSGTSIFQGLCSLAMAFLLVGEFITCGECISYLTRKRIKCKILRNPCTRILPSICDKWMCGERLASASCLDCYP